MFACLYENGLGIKVPAAIAEKLVDGRTIIWFQPLGRAKMKEWVQINRSDSKKYLDDFELLMLDHMINP